MLMRIICFVSDMIKTVNDSNIQQGKLIKNKDHF